MQKNILLSLCILGLGLQSISQPTQTNITYGSHVQQKLDYYSAASTNSPIIVVVHGGGWVTGSKSDPSFQNISQLFKNAGYAVVNINYKLDTAVSYAGYPEQPSELACAIAWTKQNAGLFNGDSSRVALYGHSAGGHLVTLHGLHAYSALLSGCAYGAGLNVAGVMATSGVYDFNAANPNRWVEINNMLVDSTNQWVDAQPIKHVAPKVNTKFLCITGQNDGFVGQQQALNFRDSMLAHQQCIVFKYLAGYNHNALISNLTATDTVFRLMTGFLDSLWLNKLCSAPTSVQELQSGAADQLHVFPNPAQRTFTIELPPLHSDIRIQDVTGRTVYQLKNAAGKIEIDCKELVSGVYFIRAFNNTHTAYNEKVVIGR